MVYLGNDIKQLRIQNGYTQEQVATKLGVKARTVGTWERDLKLPSAEMLVKLARLYHVSLNYLVGLDKEMCIDITNLTDNQKQILNDIVLEFNNKLAKGLTEERQKILGDVLKEFSR